MKRLVVLLAALVAVAPAAAKLPLKPSGSSIGEGVPLKAYATLTPTVHLFGDVVTAKIAVVADTKWVEPDRLRVLTQFAPYTATHSPRIVRLHVGRFEQVTWTWRLRCLDAACIPRSSADEKSHVFRFPPARIDYIAANGGQGYGIHASWPSVEALSQVSPGMEHNLLRRRIHWQFALAPVAAPAFRIPAALLFWLAVGLAAALAAASGVLLTPWYTALRNRRRAPVAPGTPLERALGVLRYAHRVGDETLQRKAFERVADELGVERADELALLARELAWSPQTPEDQEIDAFAARALAAEEGRA
jgi:hypothetical protein